MTQTTTTEQPRIRKFVASTELVARGGQVKLSWATNCSEHGIAEWPGWQPREKAQEAVDALWAPEETAFHKCVTLGPRTKGRASRLSRITDRR